MRRFLRQSDMWRGLKMARLSVPTQHISEFLPRRIVPAHRLAVARNRPCAVRIRWGIPARQDTASVTEERAAPDIAGTRVRPLSLVAGVPARPEHHDQPGRQPSTTTATMMRIPPSEVPVICCHPSRSAVRMPAALPSPN